MSKKSAIVGISVCLITIIIGGALGAKIKLNEIQPANTNGGTGESKPTTNETLSNANINTSLLQNADGLIGSKVALSGKLLRVETSSVGRVIGFDMNINGIDILCYSQGLESNITPGNDILVDGKLLGAKNNVLSIDTTSITNAESARDNASKSQSGNSNSDEKTLQIDNSSTQNLAFQSLLKAITKLAWTDNNVSISDVQVAQKGNSLEVQFDTDKFINYISGDENSIDSYRNIALLTFIDFSKDELKKYPNLDHITLSFVGMGLDSYSNPQKQINFEVGMTRETFNKVNWDNFTVQMATNTFDPSIFDIFNQRS